MATLIDSFFISIGVDGKGIEKGLGDVERKLSGGFKGLISRVIAPLAGALTVGSLFKNFLNEANTLGDIAQSLNLNVQELDAWGLAVQREGGTAQGFQNTLQNLTRRITDITELGLKGSEKIFKQFGVTLKNTDGTVKASVDVLRDLAGAAERLTESQFVGLATSLRLEPGVIRLLQKGRNEVDKITNSLKILSYTQEDTVIATEFNASWITLTKAFQATANIIFRMITPAFTSFVGGLTDIVVFLRKNERFVQVFFITLATIITAKLIPAFAALALAILANPLTWIIGGIILLVGGLAVAIEDLIVYINGGSSELDRLWEVFGTGEEISEGLKEAWDALKIAGDALWEAAKFGAQKFIEYFGPAFQGVFDTAKGILKLFKGIFTADFELIGEAVKDIFKGIFNTVVGYITGIIKSLVDGVEEVLALIPGLSDLTIGNTMEAVKKARNQAVAGFIGADNPELAQAASAVKAPVSFSAAGLGAAAGEIAYNYFFSNTTVETQATDAQGLVDGLDKAARERSTQSNNGSVR